MTETDATDVTDMTDMTDVIEIGETTMPTRSSRRSSEPTPDMSSAPTMIPIRAFRTPVRGHAFAAPPPGGEPPLPGVPAELAREPDNPADPLAVAVWASPSNGARWRIGYLDRGVAARVAPRLDAGSRVRAQFDGWSTEPEGRWRRPLVLLLPEDPDDAAAPARPEAPAAAPTRSETSAADSARSEAPAETPSGEGRSAPVHRPGAPRAGAPREIDAGSDALPGLWGRQPGVRRRRVS